MSEVFFPDSDISNGHLSSGPNGMPLAFGLAVEGFTMVFPLKDCVIKADVVAGSSGVTATNGIFSGILLKKDWTAMIDRYEVECIKDPVPPEYADVCSYLGAMRSAESMMFDLYRNPDGTYIPNDDDHPANASSWCLQFTMAEANIVGYQP